MINRYCFEIDTFEDIIKEAISMIFAHDSLDTHLAHFGVDDCDMEEGSKKINTLIDTSNAETTLSWTIKYEPLPVLANTPTPLSLESPPVLELKPLLTILKYVFLRPNGTLPMIIASDLTSD